MASKLQVGDFAPDFKLPDQNGRSVSLADFKGKSPLVLVFYTSDLSPESAEQLVEVNEVTEQLKGMGAVVLALSKGGRDSHIDFAKKHKLSMPLLIDHDMVAAASYEALGGFGPFKGIRPTSVVVDSSGQIIYYRHGGPNPKELVAALGSQSSPATLGDGGTVTAS